MTRMPARRATFLFARLTEEACLCYDVRIFLRGRLVTVAKKILSWREGFQ